MITLASIANGALEKNAAALNIAALLGISANMKALHVHTRRYAQHMALDEVFEDLNGALDKFNECVQGYWLRKKGSRLTLDNPEIKFVLPSDDKIFDAVKGLETQFVKEAKKVIDGSSALTSLMDDILNCFYQLYYRLDLH